MKTIREEYYITKTGKTILACKYVSLSPVSSLRGHLKDVQLVVLSGRHPLRFLTRMTIREGFIYLILFEIKIQVDTIGCNYFQ